MMRRWLGCGALLATLHGCARPAAPPVQLFPPPPAPPLAVYLGRLDEAPLDGPTPRDAAWRALLGDAVFPSTPLSRPAALAADDTRLFICDPPAGAVLVLDFANRRASFLTGLTRPTAAALGPDGRVFVGDGRRLIVFDRSLRFAEEMTLPDSSGRQAITALAVDVQHLYVATAAPDSLRAVSLADRSWHELSSGRRTLPAGLCILHDRLVVADALGGGLYASAPPQSGMDALTSDRMLRPRQVAATPGGRIAVVDAASAALRLLTADGRAVLVVSDPALLPVPTGVACSTGLMQHYRGRLPAGFDASCLLVVANQGPPPGLALFALARTADRGELGRH